MMRNRKIFLGLGLTVILDTVVQMLWKFAVTTIPANQPMGAMLRSALHQPSFLLLVVVAAAQFINWLIVLEYAELSYAKPIASLSYITVCLTSAVLFKEHIGFLKASGIIFVLAGVYFLAASANVKSLTKPSP